MTQFIASMITFTAPTIILMMALNILRNILLMPLSALSMSPVKMPARNSVKPSKAVMILCTTPCTISLKPFHKELMIGHTPSHSILKDSMIPVTKSLIKSQIGLITFFQRPLSVSPIFLVIFCQDSVIFLRNSSLLFHKSIRAPMKRAIKAITAAMAPILPKDIPEKTPLTP